MPKPKPVRFSISLRPEMFAALMKRAAEERRPVSTMAAILIEDALGARAPGGEKKENDK